MDVVLSGRYRLIETLGQGGMGEVWRGLDTRLNRPVAVKMIRLSAAPSAHDYAEAARRFRREAQAVAGLNHPNIVAAYDYGIDSDSDAPYLVMEMIEGRSLKADMAERAESGEGPLPLSRVRAIAADVCAGLGAAHAAGVIHRDLKPANLMTVSGSGRVKIVDFGTARGAHLTQVTQTGLIVGTVAYLSPEILENSAVDGRSDLYALGCVLFELLTGYTAYDAEGPAQFMAAHLHRAPRRLRAYLPELPEALEELLLDMLEKDPDRRPATAGEVARRLTTALPDLKPPHRPRAVTVPRQTSKSKKNAAKPTAPAKPSAAAKPATATKATGGSAASRATQAEAGAVPAATTTVETAAMAVFTGDSEEMVAPAPSDAAPTEATRSADRDAVPVATEPDGDPEPVDAVEGDADQIRVTPSVAAGPSADAGRTRLDVRRLPLERAARDRDPGTSGEVPDLRPPQRKRLRLAAVAAVLALVAGGTTWALMSQKSPSGTANASTGSPRPGASRPHGSASASASASTPASPSPAGSTVLTVLRSMSGSAGCGTPSQLSFNHDGTQLAGAGGSGIACVWGTSKGKVVFKTSNYGHVLGAQLVQSNGALAAVTSNNGTPIRLGAITSVGTGLQDSLSSPQHFRSGLEAVAVSPDGGTVAVSYHDDGTIQFYSLGNHSYTGEVDGKVHGRSGTLTFSADGSRIAHATAGGIVVTSTKSRLWTGPGASAAAFLDGHHLIACDGNKLSLYDTSGPTAPAKTAAIDGNCVGLAVQPGGHDIAVSTTDHGIELLKLPADWS